jgi:hypothetical protein
MLLKRVITTIILSTTIALAAYTPAWATLIDGEYELSLIFDQPLQNERHTGIGSFSVTGGTIENVLVNFVRGSLSPYDYTGTNFIESAGTLFSAQLTAPLPSLSGSNGAPFLTLYNDGTFICGGYNLLTIVTNHCLLSHSGTSEFAISDVSNSPGTYSFSRVASPVPAPASLALILLGLGALRIVGRRKVTA